ncbi:MULTISPECIES: ester cyclase [Vibrio]|mgnify:CR=1 FL=1|jgi:predicted ester cyclase|uniref:Polyketide cyclase n=2 Tax=Vibrio lentus TaxID=136468 RepID=A0A1B9Q958_9VIBR|nr:MULTISPECIES: ester cyclase [Vibrio]CAK3714324.1 Polyketide cyclase [Vibrio crassostreae]OCH56399.1 polyketide cyclase [Vibrio lentus]PHX07446.1 SnoaL-like polyketide cyclase [Vibrio splendidus]PME48446.1 polyketide cyclase [Vibrio lentus]PME67485.1 polyketide cyclase [Vibrio lentus]
MSVEEVVRGFIEEVRSGKQLDLVNKYLAQVVVAHQIVSGVSQAIERTPENYREHVEEFLEAYGNFDLKVEEFLVQGAKVYVRWRQEGRHEGVIYGYEPTGLELSTVGSAVYRVSENQIAEYWIQQENQGLRGQLEENLKKFS